MSTACALAEQEKTNYAQEQLGKSEEMLMRWKKGKRHAGMQPAEPKQTG